MTTSYKSNRDETQLSFEKHPLPNNVAGTEAELACIQRPGLFLGREVKIYRCRSKLLQTFFPWGDWAIHWYHAIRLKFGPGQFLRI